MREQIFHGTKSKKSSQKLMHRSRSIAVEAKKFSRANGQSAPNDRTIIQIENERKSEPNKTDEYFVEFINCTLIEI